MVISYSRQNRGLRITLGFEINLQHRLMMNNLAYKQAQGISVQQNSESGFVNVTHLSKLHFNRTGVKREPSEWLSNKRTQQSIDHLASVLGFPVTELVIVVQGGEPTQQGTWLHPKLSVRYSIWLSDEIGYAVECIMEEWMLGKITQPKPEALPARLVALETAQSINYIQETLGLTNPRIAQMLVDHTLRDIADQQPALPQFDDRLMGVIEIATQLGYPLPKSDSALGRKVAKAYRDAGLGEPQTDKRECGGALREMKVYPCSEPIVKEAIRSYYDN